ncbi:DNA-3-methyladenine glycosylase-like isoform X1 [Silene latifolia]|uniref:DNA-3-methyladenine glycosylase-like isoform X1 n=1 Tax=Silene latifolia TaxID=37657 RepID=UPI003D77EF74
MSNPPPTPNPPPDPNPPSTSANPNPTPTQTKLLSRPRKLRKLSPSQTATQTSSATQTNPPTQTRPLSYPNEITLALTHLRTSDPTLTPLLTTYQPPSFDAFQPPFLALTKSILYQQLAYKAGTSIYSRFVSLCGGSDNVLPSTVLSLSPSHLRQIGVSARKSSYLHDLAKKYVNGVLSDKMILSLDDKSLFTMLTMVNGIGSWSVHMFMIFSLHRPDVLPVNDLQVRKGVQLLYGLEELPRPSQMEQLCERWRPYRSVGAWYMWRLVESKASASAGSSGEGNSGVAVGMGVPRPLQVVLPGPQQEQQQQQQRQHPQQQQQQQQLLQRQHPQQQQQQHHLQSQFIDPINGIMNVGSNYAQLN